MWDELWNRASFLDGASADTIHDFARGLVIGKFAARIETVQNSTNPVIMTASVGWASSSARQQYDWDETFREPITNRFASTGEGDWVEVKSGELWSDAEIIEAMLLMLGDWLRSDGRYE